MQTIPRGIEVLVKKAAVDSAFKAILLAERSAAARRIDLELAAPERLMLDSVPAAQLQAIIARTKVEPSAIPALMGKAAAAMIVALGLTAMSMDGCIPPFSYGINADKVLRARTTSATQSSPTSRVVSPNLPVSHGQRVESAPMPPRVAGMMPQPPASTPASSPATSSAPATAKALSDAEFDQLLVQLDNQDWQVRKAAQDQLKAAGPGALAQVDKALQRKDLSPEVRSSLEQARQAARATTMPRPSVRMAGIEPRDD